MSLAMLKPVFVDGPGYCLSFYSTYLSLFGQFYMPKIYGSIICKKTQGMNFFFFLPEFLLLHWEANSL